ncbi:MAG: ChaN family lipoprotein [Oligoflexales bacterium]
MNKKDRLLALQYSLYERIRSRIYNITGPDPEELLEYEHSFLSKLPNTHSDGQIAKFKKSVDKCQFILFGDFHALPSNQQDYLDLLIYQYHKKNQKKIIIALECFSIDDQAHIDAYMLGDCDEKSFLTVSEYARNWGFPWQPIKKILDFARKHHLPVIGINVGKGESFSLSQRDKIFAQHLLKAVKKYEGYKLLYLVGEHHLSIDHLPRQIVEQSKGKYSSNDLMVVLSNTDKYYFASLEEAHDKASTCFYLGENNYCILDTPPWGKWLSYLVWQEHVLMQPGCDTCVHPWAKHGEEQCCYDTDEYFLECFGFFLKYFGEGESYQALCNYFNRVVAVEKEYFRGHEMENTWAFYRFEHFDSAFFPDKKIIYWKPLSWRGMISAIAQCLSLKNKSNKDHDSEDFFYENVKASLSFYSILSMFNPLGFLDQSWIKKNLLGYGNRFLFEENIPINRFFSAQFNPYLYSHGIGQSLANMLNKNFHNQDHCYDYVHKLLKTDEVIWPSMISDLEKLNPKKHA